MQEGVRARPSSKCATRASTAIVAGTITDYDLALSQVSITCDRAKVVTFTMPYFESNQGVLVNADSDVQVTTLAEAKKIKWGVQTGTTAIDLLDSIGTDQQPERLPAAPGRRTPRSRPSRSTRSSSTPRSTSGEAARSNGTFKVVSQFEQDGGPDQYGAILPKDSERRRRGERGVEATEGLGRAGCSSRRRTSPPIPATSR